jgi:hypothetical protein
VPVTLDPGEEVSAVRLEGELGIGTARELKDLLVDALASGKRLRIELAGAPVFGVTVYQLLWAARCETKRAGVEFLIQGPVAAGISLAMEEAGLPHLTAALR